MDERTPLLGTVEYDNGDTRNSGDAVISNKEPPSEEVSDKEVKADICGQYIPRRYILILMLFFATSNCFALRVNFNVALLAMVNSTNEDIVNTTTEECPGQGNIGNSTKGQEGEFNWSSSLESLLLGSFYYGYTVAQPFAGLVAERFGAKRLLALGGVSAGVLNLLMPAVARWNVYALVGMRMLLGFVLGPIWPAMSVMVARWTLTTERAKLYAICNAGLYIGTVVSQSVSGALCASEAGWPSPLYVFGAASALWGVGFWFLTAETPGQHPSISRAEREMIESNTGDTKYRKPPWKKMIVSRPLWALFIVLFMDIMAYDILFTYLPLYMKRVLKYDIAASGGLSSVPYVISLVTTYLAGYSADVIRNHGWLGTMCTRRLYTIAGDFLPAMCVLLITFANCDRNLVVALFILCISLTGFNIAGFGVSMFDLAPIYAGTIYGVINGLSNIGGFLGPLIVGAITQNSGSILSWHIIFYIIAALYTFGVVVFCVFGSADLQPWAHPQYENSQETEVKTVHENIHENVDTGNVIA